MNSLVPTHQCRGEMEANLCGGQYSKFSPFSKDMFWKMCKFCIALYYSNTEDLKAKYVPDTEQPHIAQGLKCIIGQ